MPVSTSLAEIAGLLIVAIDQPAEGLRAGLLQHQPGLERPEPACRLWREMAQFLAAFPSRSGAVRFNVEAELNKPTV